MLIKCVLTRLEVREDHPMRTTSITGLTGRIPELGYSFAILGESLTEGAAGRLLTTSKIDRVEEHPDGTHFWTESGSHYLFQFAPQN